MRRAFMRCTDLWGEWSPWGSSGVVPGEI
jgi:hypothetical protein